MNDAQRVKRFAQEAADKLSLLQRNMPMTAWPSVADEAFWLVIEMIEDEGLPAIAVDLAAGVFYGRLSQLALMADTASARVQY